MSFNGFQSGERIKTYYDGGYGGYGSGPGPYYGITWSWNALAYQFDYGQPDPPGFMSVNDGTYDDTVYMNDAAGMYGLSFYYVSIEDTGWGEPTVTAWTGLNGTGAPLASISVPDTGPGTGYQYNWTYASLSWTGEAESITFYQYGYPAAGWSDVAVTGNAGTGGGGTTPAPAAIVPFASGLLCLIKRKR